MINTDIVRIDCDCPECGKEHVDRDYWALNPHKTHLCEHCGSLFPVTERSVSRSFISSEFHQTIKHLFEN